MEAETRAGCEFRVAGRTLSGVVLRYGDVAPQHRERFLPGALAPVPDVPLNIQHDKSLVVLEAGSFALTDSERMLEVRAELPEGSAAAIQLVRTRGTTRILAWSSTRSRNVPRTASELSNAPRWWALAWSTRRPTRQAKPRSGRR